MEYPFYTDIFFCVFCFYYYYYHHLGIVVNTTQSANWGWCLVLTRFWLIGKRWCRRQRDDSQSWIKSSKVLHVYTVRRHVSRLPNNTKNVIIQAELKQKDHETIQTTQESSKFNTAQEKCFPEDVKINVKRNYEKHHSIDNIMNKQITELILQSFCSSETYTLNIKIKANS